MSNDEKIIEVVGQAIRAELRPDRDSDTPLNLDHDGHEYRNLAVTAINAMAAFDEVEWEYVVQNGMGNSIYMAYSLREAVESIAADQAGPGLKPKRSLMRRRKAGPWEAVDINAVRTGPLSESEMTALAEWNRSRNA